MATNYTQEQIRNISLGLPTNYKAPASAGTATTADRMGGSGSGGSAPTGNIESTSSGGAGGIISSSGGGDSHTHSTVSLSSSTPSTSNTSPPGSSNTESHPPGYIDLGPLAHSLPSLMMLENSLNITRTTGGLSSSGSAPSGSTAVPADLMTGQSIDPNINTGSLWTSSPLNPGNWNSGNALGGVAGGVGSTPSSGGAATPPVTGVGSTPSSGGAATPPVTGSGGNKPASSYQYTDRWGDLITATLGTDSAGNQVYNHKTTEQAKMSGLGSEFDPNSDKNISKNYAYAKVDATGKPTGIYTSIAGADTIRNENYRGSDSVYAITSNNRRLYAGSVTQGEGGIITGDVSSPKRLEGGETVLGNVFPEWVPGASLDSKRPDQNRETDYKKSRGDPISVTDGKIYYHEKVIATDVHAVSRNSDGGIRSYTTSDGQEHVFSTNESGMISSKSRDILDVKMIDNTPKESKFSIAGGTYDNNAGTFTWADGSWNHMSLDEVYSLEPAQAKLKEQEAAGKKYAQDEALRLQAPKSTSMFDEAKSEKINRRSPENKQAWWDSHKDELRGISPQNQEALWNEIEMPYTYNRPTSDYAKGTIFIPDMLGRQIPIWEPSNTDILGTSKGNKEVKSKTGSTITAPSSSEQTSVADTLTAIQARLNLPTQSSGPVVKEETTGKRKISFGDGTKSKDTGSTSDNFLGDTFGGIEGRGESIIGSDTQLAPAKDEKVVKLEILPLYGKSSQENIKDGVTSYSGGIKGALDLGFVTIKSDTYKAEDYISNRMQYYIENFGGVGMAPIPFYDTSTNTMILKQNTDSTGKPINYGKGYTDALNTAISEANSKFGVKTEILSDGSITIMAKAGTNLPVKPVTPPVTSTPESNLTNLVRSTFSRPPGESIFTGGFKSYLDTKLEEDKAKTAVKSEDTILNELKSGTSSSGERIYTKDEFIQLKSGGDSNKAQTFRENFKMAEAEIISGYHAKDEFIGYSTDKDGYSYVVTKSPGDGTGTYVYSKLISDSEILNNKEVTETLYGDAFTAKYRNNPSFAEQFKNEIIRTDSRYTVTLGPQKSPLESYDQNGQTWISQIFRPSLDRDTSADLKIRDKYGSESTTKYNKEKDTYEGTVRTSEESGSFSIAAKDLDSADWRSAVDGMKFSDIKQIDHVVNWDPYLDAKGNIINGQMLPASGEFHESGNAVYKLGTKEVDEKATSINLFASIMRKNPGYDKDNAKFYYDDTTVNSDGTIGKFYIVTGGENKNTITAVGSDQGMFGVATSEIANIDTGGKTILSFDTKDMQKILTKEKDAAGVTSYGFNQDGFSNIVGRSEVKDEKGLVVTKAIEGTGHMARTGTNMEQAATDYLSWMKSPAAGGHETQKVVINGQIKDGKLVGGTLIDSADFLKNSPVWQKERGEKIYNQLDLGYLIQHTGEFNPTALIMLPSKVMQEAIHGKEAAKETLGFYASGGASEMIRGWSKDYWAQGVKEANLSGKPLGTGELGAIIGGTKMMAAAALDVTGFGTNFVFTSLPNMQNKIDIAQTQFAANPDKSAETKAKQDWQLAGRVLIETIPMGMEAVAVFSLYGPNQILSQGTQWGAKAAHGAITPFTSNALAHASLGSKVVASSKAIGGATWDAFNVITTPIFSRVGSLSAGAIQTATVGTHYGKLTAISKLAGGASDAFKIAGMAERSVYALSIPFMAVDAHKMITQGGSYKADGGVPILSDISQGYLGAAKHIWEGAFTTTGNAAADRAVRSDLAAGFVAANLMGYYPQQVMASFFPQGSLVARGFTLGYGALALGTTAWMFGEGMKTAKEAGITEGYKQIASAVGYTRVMGQVVDSFHESRTIDGWAEKQFNDPNSVVNRIIETATGKTLMGHSAVKYPATYTDLKAEGGKAGKKAVSRWEQSLGTAAGQGDVTNAEFVSRVWREPGLKPAMMKAGMPSATFKAIQGRLDARARAAGASAPAKVSPTSFSGATASGSSPGSGVTSFSVANSVGTIADSTPSVSTKPAGPGRVSLAAATPASRFSPTDSIATIADSGSPATISMAGSMSFATISTTPKWSPSTNSLASIADSAPASSKYSIQDSIASMGESGLSVTSPGSYSYSASAKGKEAAAVNARGFSITDSLASVADQGASRGFSITDSWASFTDSLTGKESLTESPQGRMTSTFRDSMKDSSSASPPTIQGNDGTLSAKEAVTLKDTGSPSSFTGTQSTTVKPPEPSPKIDPRIDPKIDPTIAPTPTPTLSGPWSPFFALPMASASAGGFGSWAINKKNTKKMGDVMTSTMLALGIMGKETVKKVDTGNRAVGEGKIVTQATIDTANKWKSTEIAKAASTSRNQAEFNARTKSIDKEYVARASGQVDQRGTLRKIGDAVGLGNFADMAKDAMTWKTFSESMTAKVNRKDDFQTYLEQKRKSSMAELNVLAAKRNAAKTRNEQIAIESEINRVMKGAQSGYNAAGVPTSEAQLRELSKREALKQQEAQDNTRASDIMGSISGGRANRFNRTLPNGKVTRIPTEANYMGSSRPATYSRGTPFSNVGTKAITTDLMRESRGMAPTNTKAPVVPKQYLDRMMKNQTNQFYQDRNKQMVANQPVIAQAPSRKETKDVAKSIYKSLFQDIGSKQEKTKKGHKPNKPGFDGGVI